MFERFTSGARDAVRDAVVVAGRAGAAVVTEEHLLLALLGQGTLDPVGVDRAAVAAGLTGARHRGGLSEADEDALAELGIDVSEIVARMEETYAAGAPAMAGPARRRGPLRTLLGRGGSDDRAGTYRIPFSTDAKQALERSLRVALDRRDNAIGAHHLVLALLSRPSAVADVLVSQGVTYERAEAALC